MTAQPPRGGRRDRSGWLAAALLVAAVVAVYAPLAGRGFASEDFLLIRVLRQQPPWHDWTALAAGPWLGIEVVRFYRPLSLLLLAVEARLFGGHALPYGLVHLAVHLLNVLLVHRLALRLMAPDPVTERGNGDDRGPGAAERRGAASLAALLFALYPLHPNAVSWIASYATLFAATFVLAAALAWEAWRRGDGAPSRLRGGRYTAVLALYAAALLAYEAAVVLPAALLWRELLSPGAAAAPGGSSVRHRRLATLPLFALGAVYLLLRGALLGQVVGGYGSFAERLFSAGPGGLIADAVLSLQRLFVPAFDAALPAWVAPAVLLLVASLPLLVLPPGRPPRRRRRLAARADLALWLFAWGWMLIFLAPFAFQPFVPANGRYAYLASVGAALALAQLAAMAWSGLRGAAARRGWRTAGAGLTVAFVVLLVIGWAVRLVGLAAAMEQAGESARRVQRELVALAASAPPGPLLVADHPRFVRSATGVPLAQVLRYGLADALQPPFTAPEEAPRGVLVYPLPEGPADGARAAFGAARAAGGPPATFAVWEAAAGRFQPPAPPAPGAGAPALLAAAGGASGRRGQVAVRPFAGADAYRLVVLTRGNPARVEVAAPPAGGEVVADVPRDFVRSMRHLYADPPFGGAVYWWIEARAADGDLLAVSAAAPLPSP